MFVMDIFQAKKLKTTTGEGSWLDVEKSAAASVGYGANPFSKALGKSITASSCTRTSASCASVTTALAQTSARRVRCSWRAGAGRCVGRPVRRQGWLVHVERDQLTTSASGRSRPTPSSASQDHVHRPRDQHRARLWRHRRRCCPPVCVIRRRSRHGFLPRATPSIRPR